MYSGGSGTNDILKYDRFEMWERHVDIEVHISRGNLRLEPWTEPCLSSGKACGAGGSHAQRKMKVKATFLPT